MTVLPTGQSITLDLHRGNTTCRTSQKGDITHHSIPWDPVVIMSPYIRYPPRHARRFGANVSGTDSSIVLHLVDDTACTHTALDVLNGDGSTECAPQSQSGAGWMSFKLETVK